MSRLLASLSVVAMSLGLISSASAECAVYYGFERVVSESPIVVVGRVVTVNPGSIDLEVSWVAKGSVANPRVRVWDPWANGFDNARLDRLRVGPNVVLAGILVAGLRRDLHGSLFRLDVAAQPTDLAVLACRESYRVLDSAEALREFIGKTIP